MSREEQAGYEKRDVRVGMIFIALGFMALAGLLLGLQVWFLFGHFRAEYAARDVRRTQVEARQVAPPEPLLEVDPRANWETYRAQQQRELSTYGWASREQERVRIPIGRAMELMVQRQALPQR